MSQLTGNLQKQQPDNLVDLHNRVHTYLRISITDRCNLRCQYCMPAEGIEWIPHEDVLTFEEIRRVAVALAGVGVNKIRLTGGEPTVRRGLESLIASVASIPGIEEIAMTTNGTTLPRLASVYREAGLTALNVSMDTLNSEKFLEITRTNKHQVVLDGIEAALNCGFTPLKLNVVVMRGVNDDEVFDFVEYVKDRPINVRFIEFMPFDGNDWSKNRLLPSSEILARLKTRYTITPLDCPSNAVAKDFAVQGYQGTVSFISSMSNAFCSGCNRIRLTALGEVKPCLFMPSEVGLREQLRAGATEAEIVETVRSVLQKKWRAHPGAENLVQLKNASMIQIGG